MRFGWIGGTLVVGGCALFMIAAAIAVGGGSVGLGIRDVGGLVLAASLALVLAGLLLILLGTISRGNAVAVLGLIAVLLGGTGVGVLGVKGVRSAPAVPA